MPGPANAQVLVEVAVDSLAGAKAAVAAGANRLELCSSLGEGGLTPSLGLLEGVLAAVHVPVVAMVRPRPGDFLYDASEFDVMRRDVRHLQDAGAHGITSGILLANGHLDGQRLAELIAIARNLPFTCHRAFDLCADPAAAIETLVAIGAVRVLTSGQAATAPAGTAAIAQHVRTAGTRLAVIAGAGVRAAAVAELVAATGVREVHLSASAWQPSAMTFRRPGVPMGMTAAADDYAHRTTDGSVVAAVVAALRRS